MFLAGPVPTFTTAFGKLGSQYSTLSKATMKRLQRQLPFLQSVLQQANRLKRQDLLQHANADQINAISELALNLLKNRIPLTPQVMAKLLPHKEVSRGLGQRKHSVKKRRDMLLQQERSGLFRALHECLCQCLNKRVC